MSFNEKFNGSTVLITGHTGFKGSWLSIWLKMLGAKVVGVSHDIPTEPSNFIVSDLENSIVDHRVDIRNTNEVQTLVKSISPDFVFHLAAQALVRTSYDFPILTFETNVLGTINVLNALNTLEKPVVAVMITSDKAYDNLEWVWGYRETDRLGGKDPYSASKGMAELSIRSYIESFFKHSHSNVRVGVARAGNVIGGGDWAKDRIVPDCVMAWSEGKQVDIRSPSATRPWQHVLEPLSGYLALACNLVQSNENQGQAYNFGPSSVQNYSVQHLIDEMGKYWDKVHWNDISRTGKHLHEAGLLKLNCDKALFDLSWEPTLRFDVTIKMTIEWYKAYYQKEVPSMYEFTKSQIQEYTKLAQLQKIKWAYHD
jgi:CDP-glucose 4,6-dehydratase